jgi:hypothetical protein
MKGICSLLALLCLGTNLYAQLEYPKDKIVSNVAKGGPNAEFIKNRQIVQANAIDTLPIGSTNEMAYPLEIGLWSISQFMIKTPESERGVKRLMKNWDALSQSTQRSLLEVVYGLYPKGYEEEVRKIFNQANQAKIAAIAGVYLWRIKPSEALRSSVVARVKALANNDYQIALANAMDNWLKTGLSEPVALPPLDSLFTHQQAHKFKVVYSFQRFNRDYPGLAIVQNTDGTFMRDDSGRLKTFVQLARSASNLPYFITNGSTPQGLYAITGTEISKNPFIGPTPNLQMGMMYEINPPVFTHYMPLVFNAPPERIYRSYFPPSWQNWDGLMESYAAGKAGRSEIIAHGTTIDPEWFAGSPYYPISPTLGCLCGREVWNKTTGKIEVSDQLELVNTFLSTPGRQGYMIVINLNNLQGAVSGEELEKVVRQYESALAAK